MIGSIPKKLKVFLSTPTEVQCKFDDSEILVGEIKTVLPAFISDANNKNTCNTGEQWASHYGQRQCTSELIDNDPIKDVIITSLEHRGNGGRAYKVIVNNKYYVDLREDVLLECILSTGINAGGKLNGEYIWARVGSAMKLIRVNSVLHDELIKSTELIDKPVLKKLEIGRVYKSKTESVVYLGEYSNIIIIPDESGHADYTNYSWIYHRDKSIDKPKIRLKKQKKVKVFYQYDETKKSLDYSYIGYFSIKQTHSYKVETDIKMDIPDNWLDEFKKSLMTKFKEEFGETPSSKFNTKGYRFVDWLLYYSTILNIGESELHPFVAKHVTVLEDIK